MKAFEKLPDGYRKIYSIDLQKDTKKMLAVNAIAILISVIMCVPMHFALPISTLFTMEYGLKNYILRFAVLFIALVLYMVLHELVHGVTMKMCGTKKVKYGLKGMYAFAGSNDFYDKKSYIIIALAPVVVWGIVLAVLICFVSEQWFWIVYIVQIGNISGAAGDLFVTVKFSSLPKDILMQDYGVGMSVYSKEK